MAGKQFEISKDNRENRKRLNGALVAVLGAARSGIALAELLTQHGARVLLSEQKNPHYLEYDVQALEKKGIQMEFGGHSEAILGAELICISPGLPLTLPVLRQAMELKIPIVGEMEVASWFLDTPIIAITGSNGKTTTTTLTGEILKKKIKNLLVGGNIGVPLSRLILNASQFELTLLEVSSFQLETIVNFHPEITVIMNLSPNHLDRYPNYEAYVEAKLNILKNVTTNDVLIYNADDHYLTHRMRHVECQKIPFSIEQELKEGAYWKNDRVYIRLKKKTVEIPLTSPQLRGPHNRYNMTVAALIGWLHDVKIETISETILAFRGIEHRLEFVREYQGVKFVNDSKATTIASLEYALQSFEEPLVLIVGGKDKGGDFKKVLPAIRQRVREVIVLGEAAGRIKDAWQGEVPLTEVSDLKQAVYLAVELAQPGDVVLLSPACSSFDMFRDYEERGRVFKEVVNQL